MLMLSGGIPVIGCSLARGLAPPRADVDRTLFWGGAVVGE